MRPHGIAALLLLGALVAGCGDASSEAPGDQVAAEAPGSPTRSSAPTTAPDEQAALALGDVARRDQDDFAWGDELFHFLAEDGSVIDRAPWTACLSNGCWDGGPGLSGPITSAGSPDTLYFAFDYPGWDFEYVTFNPVDRKCGGRTITVPAAKIGERLFRIDPAGLAGDWRIDVFGYGSSGGDAVTSVLWTTRSDGAMPSPDAMGSLFTDEDGRRIAPYGGPELNLQDLARTPTDAAATWNVTDHAGHTISVPMKRSKQRCAADGSVSFQGPELTPDQLATLEGDRITYTVELTLDGQRFTGSALWPADERPDEAPYVDFSFEPPLPAYSG